jgi:hypothetical protein
LVPWTTIYVSLLITNWRSKFTKDTFYLRERDGDFGFLSFKDSYYICKIANMGHLLSSSIGTMDRRHITQV